MLNVGRFAPTPSGDLHFGSLLAALASFLQARSQNGIWRVRIDDVDTPRVVKYSDTSILTTLEHYQLFWDQPVVYQSSHTAVYQSVLDTLSSHTFICDCIRKKLKHFAIYPGICRHKKSLMSSYLVRCLV